MEYRTVGECFLQIRNGANIKQGTLDGGYPITRIETTANDKFNRKRMGYAGITSLDKYEDYVLQDGNLLMSHINSPQYLGRTVLYERQGTEKIIHGMNLLCLKADREIILPAYARYYFYSRDFREQIGKITKKSVNQASFAISDLKKILIPVPKIDKQRELVNILNSINRVIDCRRQELSKLEELIKARFVEMFGSIRETVPLSYYIETLVAGKSFAGEEECSNKVLKTGAATYDHFDPSQVKNLPSDYQPLPEHLIHDGDIIISRMNTAELVGAAAYVWSAPENTYLPDRLWRAVLTEKAHPIFVWQSIVQPTTKEAIRKIAGGTSGSMKNISKPGLLGLAVKKVGKEEQEQFATFVAQIDKSKLSIQASLDQLEILKQSLMQQYFG